MSLDLYSQWSKEKNRTGVFLLLRKKLFAIMDVEAGRRMPGENLGKVKSGPIPYPKDTLRYRGAGDELWIKKYKWIFSPIPRQPF